jgi:hypothetical protein
MVEWRLRVLDPATGELPADPFAGLLPPNDETGRGEGHVTFSIGPREGLPDWTVIANSAKIVFDTEQPIETNEVSNTLVNDPRGDLYEHLMGSTSLTGWFAEALDFNEDGAVDIADLVFYLVWQ